MRASAALAPLVGVAAACASLGVARATFYRALLPLSATGLCQPRTPSPWALSDAEQTDILAVLHEPAYVDESLRTVFALLLDAGRYLASVSTFYRLLRGVDATRGRRNQLTHPAYTKPELLVEGPRELWSWDIPKLKGPGKWTCFHNLYSESQFKTLKYRPDFPARFDSIEHARAFCLSFFVWYNAERRHPGIGTMTPAAMHNGHAQQCYAARPSVMDVAYRLNPARFTQRHPAPPALPVVAGINWSKPKTDEIIGTTISPLNSIQTVSHSA